MRWDLWRNELSGEFPYFVGAAILTSLVVLIALRRWRRHRLASALLIGAVLTLFGLYVALCFPETLERLSTVVRLDVRPWPPHTLPERLADVCPTLSVVACGVGLFALALSFWSPKRRSAEERTKRVGDYEGPRLDQAFDQAATRLSALWEQLSGLPEFELGGRRRLRPLAFAKFLQRSVQAGQGGTQNVRFDIVSWEEVANERVRQALLDAPMLAEEVGEQGPLTANPQPTSP